MSFDERMDRLTERHEALVQTIELTMIENRERDAKWDKRFSQLTAVVERVAESIDKLSHIAELHQHRLDSHDDRLDELEGTA
jgi:protein subunit release factor A